MMLLNYLSTVVSDEASARYLPSRNPQKSYTASGVPLVLNLVFPADVRQSIQMNSQMNSAHSWWDVEDSFGASVSECIYADPKEDLSKTILSFKDMSDKFGYDEVAPSTNGVVWLAKCFRGRYVHTTLLPAVFPTSWGGVRMEWRIGRQAAVVDIDLEERSAKWLSFHLDDDNDERDVEETIDLEGAEGWDCFNRMVQTLACTELSQADVG